MILGCLMSIAPRNPFCLLVIVLLCCRIISSICWMGLIPVLLDESSPRYVSFSPVSFFFICFFYPLFVYSNVKDSHICYHQILEDGRYSYKVDIYSFGILLGEVRCSSLMLSLSLSLSLSLFHFVIAHRPILFVLLVFSLSLSLSLSLSTSFPHESLLLGLHMLEDTCC